MKEPSEQPNAQNEPNGATSSIDNASRDYAVGGGDSFKDAVNKTASQAVDEVARKEQQELEVRKADASSHLKLIQPVVLVVLLFAFVAFLAFNNPFSIKRDHPWTKGEPLKWNDRLEDCVIVLWKYVVAVDEYRRQNEHKFPPSLDELYKIEPQLPRTCPVTGMPFVFIKAQEGVYRIEAPDPRALGVSSLHISSMHKPPVIIP